MVLMLAQPLAMALALMLMLAPMLALMLALAPAPAQARVLRPPCQHYCRKPRDARGHDGPLVRASQRLPKRMRNFRGQQRSQYGPQPQLERKCSVIRLQVLSVDVGNDAVLVQTTPSSTRSCKRRRGRS